MSSLLYPFGKVNIGTVNNTLHDLQIDTIVRYVFVDKGKQEKILGILENICTDEETIKYRQSVLRDMMYTRPIYYGLGREAFNLDKCYSDYNATRSGRAKLKVKSEMEVSETTMMLKDYAQDILKLLGIYKRLDELFTHHSPSSVGLKELSKTIKTKVENKYLDKLENLMNDILNQHSAYAFSTNLDDKLLPIDNKFILCSGKYTGEKVSLFRRKESSDGRIEVIPKVKEDFTRIVIDSFNRVVVIMEDIFESLYDAISYFSDEYIFFEFANSIYDTLGERRIDCCFPEIANYTDYKNAKDLYLAMKYIIEGYSSPIYGNNISIANKQSLLVVGSNNTGKTVFLRTLGINQIFFQNGLFVIGDQATVEIKESVTTIFSGEEKDTDVGGRFEKEVIDIKEIIDKVNDKSLVIINEIFQSTFAEDGKRALFDILNYFSEINVTWVDVTHLITILDERKKFVNSVKLYETSDETNKYQIKEI